MYYVNVQLRLSNCIIFHLRKLDLFIQNLSEATSYLAMVTPINKKGVGKTTHKIVDTHGHPAVELTQAEGASEDGKSTASGSR